MTGIEVLPLKAIMSPKAWPQHGFRASRHRPALAARPRKRPVGTGRAGSRHHPCRRHGSQFPSVQTAKGADAHGTRPAATSAGKPPGGVPLCWTCFVSSRIKFAGKVRIFSDRYGKAIVVIRITVMAVTLAFKRTNQCGNLLIAMPFTIAPYAVGHFH